MIKEFWTERAEEKRKQKELKKQNRKLPKTKEQIAYKVFSVCFVLFLIFGSIFYACRNTGDGDNYSWDNLIGVTDDVKEKLTAPVNVEDLIVDEQIGDVCWDSCIEKLSAVGLDVVLDNKLNKELLLDKTEIPESTLTLNSKTLGALQNKLLEMDSDSQDISIMEMTIYNSGSDIKLRTLVYVNLTTIVISDSLPFVYLTIDSQIEILDNELRLLNNSFIVNNLDEEDNEIVLSVISKNSLLGIDYHTTQVIAENINDFALYINTTVTMNGTDISFVPKNI